MIVVSNTSPLTNLAAVDQFDLLKSLYNQIYIADGVWSELHSEGIYKRIMPAVLIWNPHAQ